jgi:6-bladed beta-propeller
MIFTNRRYAAPVLAAALLAMAAGDAAAQGAIVRLPERDRPLAGSPTQVFAVGRAEGAEHEMFGIVESVAFDAADNLYVLDRQNPRVLVYDRTGRFVRQIGRRGQGPGELMVPVQLVVAADGTIIVQDLGRPAYSLFRPDGTFIRNVAMEGWMPMLSAELAWHPRGGVVGTFREAPAERMRMGSTTRSAPAVPLMFQPLAGGSPVRLYNVPQQWTMEQSAQPSPRGEGQSVNVRISGPPVFSPPVLFGVLGSGQMALSFTSGYTVRILDANGQTVRYLQRPVRPRLVTQADRERAREERREEIASGRGGIMITRGGGGNAPPPVNMRQMQERELENMRFADTIPALRGLRVAPSGKLWIERTGPLVAESGPIDLVTPEGQYLGTITGTSLPDAISRTGLAAYIERDEDDVQRVVVRQLPAQWR